MTSFDTESRRRAIWATDARKIVDGRAVDVYLEKIGQAEREDISHIEAVQWGLKLQEIIGREAGARLKMELKEADYELFHPKHQWMASHFDFISADGKTLVEVKNYNQSKRNQFEPETGLTPAADRAQIIHECAVHGVEHIVLAILFGGQELVLTIHKVTESEKEELIQTEAKIWASIQSKTPPECSSVEAARKLYAVSTDKGVIANAQLEHACQQLKAIKNQIKQFEEAEEKLQGFIQGQMKEAGSLITFDGKVLATWNSAKGSKRFDPKLLQAEMPEVYERYIVEQPGSRRFLIK
jgi:predicted phage-related endonuclease